MSPESLWAEPLVSTRLAEYEVWNRIYALGLGDSHGGIRLLLGRLRWLKMMPLVLARAGFLAGPVANALDALHLASVEFLRAHGQDVKLASYDVRVIKAARRLSISLFTLNRSRTLVDTA